MGNIKKNANIDINTGKFTCQVPGVYMFTFTTLSSSGFRLDCYFYKNSDRVGSVEDYNYNNQRRRGMNSNTVIVEMRAGNTFYIKLLSGDQLTDHSNKYTHFVGVRLSPL